MYHQHPRRRDMPTEHFGTPPSRRIFVQQEAGLERFAIAGQETDWDAALSGGAKKKVPASGLLSVKRKAGAEDEQSEEAERTPGKKDGKRDRKGGSTPGGHKSSHGKSPASHGKSSSKKSKGGQ